MGEGRTGGDRRDRRSGQRLTVPEAAAVLGVTVDAVRGRIRRGTLDSERESGTVYVFLDETGGDRRRPVHDQSELVEELRDQLAFLRAELEARNEELRRREEEHREEARRKDHIIMSLTQRVPEIESPRDEPHVPETVSEHPGGTPVPPERETSVQRSPDRRASWWRRFFGFE
jgi:hypothetical protein